ncbi:MAG: hypothetical protein ACLU0O_01850 [Collinsella sp.]
MAAWLLRAQATANCSSTSNVLAGRRYGIPVFGTHAHSWVMSFDSELEAFRAFAKSNPKNCTLLIDTYDVRGAANMPLRLPGDGGGGRAPVGHSHRLGRPG